MNHKHDHNEDNDLFSMKRAAAVLGVGRNVLFEGLRHLDIIEDSGRFKNRPNNNFIKDGYFKCVMSRNTTGSIVFVTKVTRSGIAYLEGLIAQHSDLFPRKK